MWSRLSNSSYAVSVFGAITVIQSSLIQILPCHSDCNKHSTWMHTDILKDYILQRQPVLHDCECTHHSPEWILQRHFAALRWTPWIPAWSRNVTRFVAGSQTNADMRSLLLRDCHESSISGESRINVGREVSSLKYIGPEIERDTGRQAQVMRIKIKYLVYVNCAHLRQG